MTNYDCKRSLHFSDDNFLVAFLEDKVEFDFVNKNVLVTGSSRGVGRAIAQRFAESGARVAIHYHKNRQAAERTFAELPGGPHLLVQGDVSDPAHEKEGRRENCECFIEGSVSGRTRCPCLGSEQGGAQFAESINGTCTCAV
jgi:NAD(P)-dependent dehydrogenase (short-subunit alcohol dehydrogenase family)